jgi:Na+/melibiose symporter-like transporter
VLVAPAFLCIFIYPDFFSSEGGRNAWYLIFPAIFNIGWASVQIAHLAIVNQLSYSQRKRDKMVVNRNGFTYIANIFVLGLSLALFLTVKSEILQFQILCLTCVGLGTASTLFYICMVREP